MKLRTVSRIVIATVIVSALAVAAWQSFAPRTVSSLSMPAGVTALNGMAPNFQLLDQNRRPTSLQAQRGHEVILTFFYSHCRDTCPLTAQKLRAVIGHLAAAEAHGIRVLIVSTDPYGDYPASVKTFLRRNGGRGWKFLIGTYHQLARVWKAYAIYADPRPGLKYPTHQAFTYFIGADGKEQAIMGDSTPGAVITQELHLLLHDGQWLKSLPVAPEVGARAPEFTLPESKGGTVDLRRFRGRPLVINFWATYCDYCVSEMPLLARTYHAAHGRFQMLGIDEQEPAFEVVAFTKQVRARYPEALDTNGNVWYNYGAVGTPVTFFVDRQGVIRAIKLGQMDKGQLDADLRSIALTH